MKKYLSIVITLIMVVSMLVGCHKAPPQPVGPKPDKKVDTIVFAIPNDVESLSPVEVCSGNCANAYNLIYEGLFYRAANGTAVPLLVESYELVNDTTYNMKIKEGVLFHDGSEVTAEDVKASLDWVGQWPVPQPHEKTIEVTGKYTFTITTPVPDSLLIENDLSASIVPKKLIDSGNDFKVNPIGTGPYKYVERSTAEWLKFESFDGYRKDPLTDNRVKTVILKVIPDSSTRTMALQNGDINYNPNVEVMDIDRLIADENIKVLESDGNLFYNLTLNTECAPFDNINVRKAIAFAIDPEAALLAALDGRGFVQHGVVADTAVGSSPKGQIHYNVDEAKAYLAASGYKPGDISMKIMVTNIETTRMAESIISDLAEIGIKAEIQNVEKAVMISETAAGNFESLLMANFVGVTYQAFMMFRTGAIGGPNRCRMSNPRFDDIYEHLIPSTMNPDELAVLYKEGVEIAQEYCGLIPICTNKNYTAYSSQLTNVQRGYTGRSFIPWIIPAE